MRKAMVRLEHGYFDTVVDGRRKYLTLQGLSRLLRHVIVRFVEQQPKVEFEPYDYSLERAGVIRARLDPSMWVWRADGEISMMGRDKLEGFSEQLAAVLLQRQGATLNDMREVLSKFMAHAQHMKAVQRIPYLALVALYNSVAGDKSVEVTAEASKWIDQELSRPSAPALVVYACFEKEPDWPIKVHVEQFQQYLSARGANSGIRFPKLFETAIRLQLAKRHLAAGDFNAYRESIEDAVDNHPGADALRLFSERQEVDQTLSWRILLPKPSHDETATSSDA